MIKNIGLFLLFLSISEVCYASSTDALPLLSADNVSANIIISNHIPDTILTLGSGSWTANINQNMLMLPSLCGTVGGFNNKDILFNSNQLNIITTFGCNNNGQILGQLFSPGQLISLASSSYNILDEKTHRNLGFCNFNLSIDYNPQTPTGYLLDASQTYCQGPYAVIDRQTNLRQSVAAISVDYVLDVVKVN